MVINRTLVYGALTATLAAAYLGLVLLLQLLLSPESPTWRSPARRWRWRAGAPARARIQELVDRRFYRRRYDAAQTLEGFGAGCATRSSSTRSAASCAASWRETMQPAHVSLWLREAAR